MRILRKLTIPIITLCMAMCLFGCGGGKTNDPEKLEDLTYDPENPYVAPEINDVVFSYEEATKNDEVIFDVTHLEEGYFSVSAVADKRLKMRVKKMDTEHYYDYDLDQYGKACFYPLQMGDGEYSLIVYKNIEDTKYGVLDSISVNVALLDEFQPYLHAGYYAFYTKDSKCIAKARELAEEASTANQVVMNIFGYITKSVRYDKPKAKDIPKGYVPDPDETMETGKGICIDYAALTAAMLRSQGIPTKVIFGNVSPNDIYHAWNMFYTEETGWVTVEFKASGKEWNRIDLTFSANGADAQFIGNGDNYVDLKEY